MATQTVSLSDGTRLKCIVEGDGDPVVMLPGWSQSAAEFKHQIPALAARHRVIALDHRGHGASDKPDHGYRIAHLARDLSEVLTAMDLSGVTLLGHSMGCSVIWALLDLFGATRVSRLVLVDQAPSCVGRPGWTDREALEAGVLLPDGPALDGFYGAIAGAGDVDSLSGILAGMFTAGLPRDELAWIAEENLKFPRPHAAALIWDHVAIDWRDVIRSITLPTLVVGAEASIFSSESQRWVASAIPGAQLEVFEAGDKGSHFMFYENPDRFNARVLDFLGQ